MKFVIAAENHYHEFAVLTESEEAQHRDYDDNKPDDINNVVHMDPP